MLPHGSSACPDSVKPNTSNDTAKPMKRFRIMAFPRQNPQLDTTIDRAIFAELLGTSALSAPYPTARRRGLRFRF